MSDRDWNGAEIATGPDPVPERTGAVGQPAGTWAPAREPFADRIDVGQLWSTVRERLWFILGLTILAVAAVVALTVMGRMRFKAHGSLYLGELQEKGGATSTQADQFDLFGARTGDVGTEIEILKSRDLIKRAILDSGLNVTMVPAGWSSPPYWRWRLMRRRLETLDPVSGQVVARNAAVVDGQSEPKRMVVEFLPNETYTLTTADGQPLGTGRLGNALVAGNIRVTLLAGPQGPPAPGSRYDIRITALDDAVEAVGKYLSIGTSKSGTSGEPLKVVSVDFIDPSPQSAARFVAALMKAYLDRRQYWKSEEATAAETFVTSQVENIKESLDASEQRLADYKKGSPVVVLGSEAKGLIEQVSKYEEQRVNAQLQVAAFNEIDAALKHPTNAIERMLVGEASDPVLSGLSAGLAQAQQELTRTQARFTGDAPALVEQQAQVDMQVKMIKSYVGGRRARAQEQLTSLNRMIAEFERKLKTVPNAEQQLTQLTRNSEVLSKMYSLLLERQQQAAVIKASTISKNHVLDVPDVPHREDSPMLALRLIIGALLGLALGTMVVVSRRLLAVTFQTDEELRHDLRALPVFGAIPSVPSERGQARPLDVFTTDPQSPFAEAFRHLRTNIYYASAGRTDKVLLITSPSQGDGKTLCTLSLAAALAADGKRVMVIEADMHRPTHQDLFDQPDQPGLSNLLTRQVSWEAAVRTVETGYGTFHAIAAGAAPPSPAELFSSPLFGSLVAYAKKAYDYVLIDAPPFPLVSDALVISMSCDRVLSVLRLRNTQRRLAEEHLARFSASTPRHGVVINGVAPVAKLGYRYQGSERTAGARFQRREAR